MSKTRHQGIMASWHQARVTRSEETLRRRGFSLIEVLLSVFILSIGVISIAALFPAGILQQRQSVDDITGPIVAQNALAILRTKLRPEDFGYGSGYTVDGDFAWSRPAFFKVDTALPPPIDGFFPAGSISIFNEALMNTTDGEIPWNIQRYNPVDFPDGPIIVFLQNERYYPMAILKPGVAPSRPQYVWDCMFRRFQGKVMVAIFVYRTTIAGGGDVHYRVPENSTNSAVPPLPISLPLAEAWDTFGLSPGNTTDDDALVPGSDPYNSADDGQSWQEPGQWILDQNNNMHRVLSQYRNDDDDPVSELVRPVPTMPVLPVYFLLDAGNQTGIEDVVSNLWYIPREVMVDTNQDGQGDLPVRLTPVYATVREL